MENQSQTQIAFENLCSKLNFNERSGLITSESAIQDAYQKYFFDYVKNKLNIDAVFFYSPQNGPSFPIIYFKQLECQNPAIIAELHKLVWNMGQAPLLFIILPTKVLIYNSYETPRMIDGDELDSTAGLIEELELFVSAESDIEKLLKYRSSELLTGNYWQENSSFFDKKKRVNETLLENLEFIRKQLLDSGLSNEIIYSLINRTIFIKYLEDRKDRNGNAVFPKDFFKKYSPSAKKFVDLLSDKHATYLLFRELSEKFNGDIFFAENEEDLITQHHLDLLYEVFNGRMHLKDRQTTLWPLYSFNVIPIELISNIYQRFVHIEDPDNKKGNRGTHYTPYHLSVFLLDQVLPWDRDKYDISILDPSCGSGIFLVESYRRLIYRWIRKNKGIRPSIDDLNRILKNNIFGVDINEKAIRIASLSLYLTLCDYLEPRDIWKNLKFVPLINNNLFISDFFGKNATFNGKKFDIIIGNPPWDSQIPPTASEYLKVNARPIGDKQICQAFLWRVTDLIKLNGEICLIVSSKSLLFNRSIPNKRFRKSFFSKVYIKTIVNFSILRHSLFSEAIGPAAAVIFSVSSESTQPIAYCTPKPSFSPQDNWLFVIEPQDIAEISRSDSINDDTIWKIAMWGNPRDYELIKKLSQLSTLGQIAKKYGWISGEGYILGKKGRKKDLWLYNKPVVLINFW